MEMLGWFVLGFFLPLWNPKMKVYFILLSGKSCCGVFFKSRWLSIICCFICFPHLKCCRVWIDSGYPVNSVSTEELSRCFF